VSELADSDDDINGGDREDNISLESGSDADSLSLNEDEVEGQADDEFNLNISFTGGYVPNTDLSRVGKNIQYVQ